VYGVGSLVEAAALVAMLRHGWLMRPPPAADQVTCLGWANAACLLRRPAPCKVSSRAECCAAPRIVTRGWASETGWPCSNGRC
jgi:hypothetical protein